MVMRLPPVCAAYLRWFSLSSAGTASVRSHSAGTAFAARVGKPWCRSWFAIWIRKRGGMGRAALYMRVLPWLRFRRSGEKSL